MAPADVEDALSRGTDLKVMCFAAPHDALGETVRTVDVRIRTLQDEMIADMNAEKTTLRPLSRTSKEGAPEEGAG